MNTNLNHLEELYAGCSVFHGELHDHAATGGTSDGGRPLSYWIEKLSELKMDFAAILDHRQVRHMYLPEWRDGLFIAGTEPGTTITDSPAEVKDIHYNMLFANRDELVKLLDEFPEYGFTGGHEGHFTYPSFTIERFCQLIDAVKAHGGFFVHPHPKQVMKADDPCCYWFRDETGIEVFYEDMDSAHTKENYSLWLALLAAGKRVFACAGGDKHSEPGVGALTTIYAEEHTGRAFLSHLREGDFTCGPVGIRMCIGNTRTGGKCDFSGKQLTVAVGDFHDCVVEPGHIYRLDVFADDRVVHSAEIPCDSMTCITLDTEPCGFYRAEVFDATSNLRIAVGNPIWNTANK